MQASPSGRAKPDDRPGGHESARDICGCGRRQGSKGRAHGNRGLPQEPEEVPRYRRAHPQGHHSHGRAGTGKTLLARAVAGEAGVPFFSISGSEFVEMFVGVGAAACATSSSLRRRPPPHYFVDEIDAVGRVRGSGVGGGKRRARADPEPDTRGDGRLRPDGEGHRHGGDQSPRRARPGLAASRSLR